MCEGYSIALRAPLRRLGVQGGQVYLAENDQRHGKPYGLFSISVCVRVLEL